MAGTEARKRRFKGTVVSDKMKNTVVVAVERLTEHPFYGKYVRGARSSWRTTKRANARRATRF